MQSRVNGKIHGIMWHTKADSVFLGWIGALIACFSFGSFGVPIKCDSAKRVDIDPLVFQTYKTCICFLTCWIVLLIGQEFSFSPWGIVSGFFWVPSGIAAIYAIKNAGLAVSQGVWSSIIVLVSFSWGIFVFHECVRSPIITSLAISLMVIGLWGMSFYSSPSTNTNVYEEIPIYNQTKGVHISSVHKDANDSNGNNLSIDFTKQNGQLKRKNPFYLGLASAMFNGVWGGSIMVPMHYSGTKTKGLGYLISFAIGAMIVTLLIWIIRFLFQWYKVRSFHNAYRSLPSFHLRIMWLPGTISGLLWSLGNLCSMISVQNLGEGIGYSVIQASMLVSGLWGIFYYQEVMDKMDKIKWLLAATLTVVAIIILSFQHETTCS